MAKENYGFVYIWYDRKHKRYYIGCRWGSEEDGYVCSSRWMKQAYTIRPQDFKRRILSRIYTNRKDLLAEEHKWLSMIRDHELKVRYYNVINRAFNHWSADEQRRVEIGAKISKRNRGKPITFKNPEERGRKISETKKRKIAEQGGLSQDHKDKLSAAHTGKKYTEERRIKRADVVKNQWDSGKRIRKEKIPKMTRKDQDAKCSTDLKSRWADPVWAANQKQRLKDAWLKRKQAVGFV